MTGQRNIVRIIVENLPRDYFEIIGETGQRIIVRLSGKPAKGLLGDYLGNWPRDYCEIIGETGQRIIVRLSGELAKGLLWRRDLSRL